MDTDFREKIAVKSDDELLDIYRHADEYQPSFIQLVADELQKRRINFDNYQQANKEKSAILQRQMEEGREGNRLYMALCLVSAFLGGILGIVGGYVYSRSKHADNTGNIYYVYNKATREKGKGILIISVVVFIAYLAWIISRL